MAGTRTTKEVEHDLRTLLSEYLEICREHRTYSFQGAVSEIAWEVEHNIDMEGENEGKKD